MQNTLEIIEFANKIFPHLKYLDRIQHTKNFVCVTERNAPLYIYETPPSMPPHLNLVQDNTLYSQWLAVCREPSFC